jgi:hypothetical protein
MVGAPDEPHMAFQKERGPQHAICPAALLLLAIYLLSLPLFSASSASLRFNLLLRALAVRRPCKVCTFTPSHRPEALLVE